MSKNARTRPASSSSTVCAVGGDDEDVDGWTAGGRVVDVVEVELGSEVVVDGRVVDVAVAVDVVDSAPNWGVSLPLLEHPLTASPSTSRAVSDFMVYLPRCAVERELSPHDPQLSEPAASRAFPARECGI
ncbi:MAG: hypothetical protein AB7R77_11870 [Ilumatobacteraceae bacterium]